MDIIAALFTESFDMRQADGGAARLDLGGVYFSTVPPSGGYPAQLTPHLLVLVRCPEDHQGLAALEVTFWRDDEQLARNLQPLTVEPGRFGYNLVQAQLEIAEPATIEARCSIDQGPVTVVPLTLLPTEG